MVAILLYNELPNRSDPVFALKHTPESQLSPHIKASTHENALRTHLTRFHVLMETNGRYLNLPLMFQYFWLFPPPRFLIQIGEIVETEVNQS